MTIKFLILLITTFSIQPSGVMDAEAVIVEKAKESITQQMKDEDTRFQLSVRWMPGSLRSLDGTNIESVRPTGSLQKYTSFEVTYTEFGSRQRAEVQLQVQAEQRIPVLIERKMRGDSVEESDLQWRWIEIDLNRDDPVTDQDKIKGKTLRRSLSAGQFISQGDIGREFLITAGDGVEMTYQVHGLQILLSCESRQDGALNEDIQIYCKETRKKYLARITGSGEVQWLKTK